MSTTIAMLIAALAAADPNQRREAAEALMAAGADARTAAVALVRAAGDDDEEVREAAVGAVEDLGPPSAEQFAELAALASDANPDVAYWAVTLLGRAEAAAKSKLPALIAALEPKVAIQVRQRAAWAIGKIGATTPEAQAALKTAATDADPRLARLAREALGN